MMLRWLIAPHKLHLTTIRVWFIKQGVVVVVVVERRALNRVNVFSIKLSACSFLLSVSSVAFLGRVISKCVGVE